MNYTYTNISYNSWRESLSCENCQSIIATGLFTRSCVYNARAVRK